MGVRVQRPQRRVRETKMTPVAALLVGTVAAVCCCSVVMVGLLLARRGRPVKLAQRKTSHVTEVLQVDMVDRRIRPTNLDCSLSMELTDFFRPGGREELQQRGVCQVLGRVVE